MNKFSIRLKELREEKKLSQAELGRVLGYTQTGIAKWESGARTPSVDAIIAIAKYFEVTTDYLLGVNKIV